MNKTVCVIFVALCCLGLLSACYDSNTHENISTSEGLTGIINSSTTVEETDYANVTEPTNEFELRSSLNAKIFLDYLKDKDLDNILPLIRADNSNESKSNYIKSYSFIRSIDVESYTITKTEYLGYFVRCQIVLNISKSGNELFPVGRSKWILEANESSVQLFQNANETIYRISELQNDIVEFCYKFSFELKCYETISDFNILIPDANDEVTISYFYDNLIRCLPVTFNDTFEVKREQLQSLTKSVLGISGLDFTKSTNYNKDEDSLYLYSPSGIWITCSLESNQFNPNTKIRTIVIDYYSDSAYIKKAKTIKYIIKENEDATFTLVSTELLFDMGIELASGLI